MFFASILKQGWRDKPCLDGHNQYFGQACSSGKGDGEVLGDLCGRFMIGELRYEVHDGKWLAQREPLHDVQGVHGGIRLDE